MVSRTVSLFLLAGSLLTWNTMSTRTGFCDELQRDSQTTQKQLNLPEITGELKPTTLLEIIQLDWELDIKGESVDQEKQMMNSVLDHIIRSADLIITNPNADGKIALKAVRNKMQALGVLARTGNKAASVQAIAMARELQKDQRPRVAREGKLIVLSSRLQEIPQMDSHQQNEYITTLLELFSAGEITVREVQIAKITAQVFERVNQIQSAQKLLKETAALLKKSTTEEAKEMAEELLGKSRRVALLGHPMKLSGKTLDGKEFDLKDLKGKVVLVQFWASWCSYCLQEMPHIMQEYQTYHDDGFEVIGVNLDDSANRANAIINDMQLSWPQLFSSKPEALGIRNPNAVYYGITSIPLCILIDRKGNVVNMQARGKILNQELERLFIHSKVE